MDEDETAHKLGRYGHQISDLSAGSFLRDHQEENGTAV